MDVKEIAKFVYSRFYGISLERIVWLMILGIGIWLVLEYVMKKISNHPFLWKLLNGMISMGIISIIIIITVLSRNKSTEVVLIPFHFLEEAKQQPEIYRSMLMNVFLFFPLGLTLPFALPERWKGKVLLAVGFAFLLSAGIEFAQYYFYLGRAEVDDIICNTFGAFLGSLALLISRFRYKRMDQKEHLKSSEQ